MDGPTVFDLKAFSVDDACGECFDKVAKLFDLGYPGGPAVEKKATNGDSNLVPMPKTLNVKNDLRFSYSGIKTHMLNLKNSKKYKENTFTVEDICASFQQAALEQISRKLNIVIDKNPDIKAITIAGGVAANQVFKKIMHKNIKKPVIFPNLRFCSDNGAMIAALGYHEWQLKWNGGHPKLHWEAFSRYPYEGVES